ncbi:hypothetical protein SynTAK9802_01572 [Synechococcus sp. TAK9802]|nr:hypothetical protein SynTAK9802_01572 [Synechococcus sp. TAK9802]
MQYIRDLAVKNITTAKHLRSTKSKGAVRDRSKKKPPRLAEARVV